MAHHFVLLCLLFAGFLVHLNSAAYAEEPTRDRDFRELSTARKDATDAQKLAEIFPRAVPTARVALRQENGAIILRGKVACHEDAFTLRSIAYAYFSGSSCGVIVNEIVVDPLGILAARLSEGIVTDSWGKEIARAISYLSLETWGAQADALEAAAQLDSR